MRKFEVLKTYAELAWAGYKEFDTKDATQEQKNVFNSKFETIKSSPENSSSGFQAKLFKDKSTGDYILSVRGTEFNPFSNPIETYKDLLKADGDLAFNNTPNSQVGDMVKFINELTKKEDEHGNAITPIIKQEDNIAIVGHSLGGTLAQVASKMYPGLFDKCYTFNSPSGKDLYSKKVYKNVDEKYFWIENDQIKYLDDNIGKAFDNYQNSPMTTSVTDVRAKDYFSMIANLRLKERFGDRIEVSGESHSSVDLTKILYFYDEMIKRRTSEKDITNYLSGFYQIPSKIFDNKKSVEHIASKTLNAINKIVNGNNAEQKDIIDIAIDFEKNNTKFSIEFIFSNGFNQSTFPNSSIPISALYALVHLNPFIVSGVDSPAYKELEKYKDEYSDNYIQDKAVMFKKALDSKAAINGIYFKDYESNLDLDTTQDFNGMYDEYHFGTNSNDTIEPIGTKISLDKNRIYALGGDDHIKAPNGSNYIEAGSGNDTMSRVFF